MCVCRIRDMGYDVYEYIRGSSSFFLCPIFPRWLSHHRCFHCGAGDCVPQDRITLSDFPSVNITLPLSGSSGISFDVAVTPSAYLLPVGRDYCMGIGTATGVGMVMGDVFMENYYVHFDRQNKQLGFSPLAPGSCVAWSSYRISSWYTTLIKLN